MADPMLPPEERDALAAELALGLLEGDQRAAALRQLMADPTFSPAVIDDWHRRLEPLYDDFVPVAPPDGLWPGIAARIDRAGPPDAVSRQLRWWRAGALAGGAIAACLALMMLTHPVPVPQVQPAAPVVVVQMTGSPDGPLIVARYDPADARLILRSSGIKPGKLSPELWIIPADGKPRSLGMIRRDGQSRISVEAAYRAYMVEGATLAVTLEPTAGVPHEAPSSAPIAAGQISRI